MHVTYRLLLFLTKQRFPNNSAVECSALAAAHANSSNYFVLSSGPISEQKLSIEGLE